jgi:hypothetical protein
VPVTQDALHAFTRYQPKRVSLRSPPESEFEPI